MVTLYDKWWREKIISFVTNLNVFYCKNNKMVRTCSVPGCRSESYSGCNISFYSFPKNENIKIKWQKNLNITRPITKFSKVCSLHFDPTSFYTPNSLRLLKKDTIPIPAVSNTHRNVLINTIMEKTLEEHLLHVIRTEHLDTISEYLGKGANPNKTVSSGMTCLGEAANMGNMEILKLLLAASKNCHSTVIYTPISWSGKRSKTHKRKLHEQDSLREESNVKSNNLNDRHKDQSKCMKPDRNQGYFVFTHNEGLSSEEGQIPGLNPLSPLCLTPSPADLEWDEDIGNVAPTTSEDETWSFMYKWYAAILENSGAAIAAASQVTNGIDQQDAFSRTALHYAADNGYVDVVKLLIEAGCKLDTPAGNGLTALHVAVAKNHLEVVRLLLDAGSNINCRTHDKMSALHYGAVGGNLDMVKLLTKRGGQVEARDSCERTALYLAAGRGHVAVVTHLISCGANVNGEDIHGYTPLCEAVWEKYAPVVEVLVRSGARVTHSHRLLHHSILHKQEDIIKLLVSQGGGMNLHNECGDTPLLSAVKCSLHHVARMLLEKGANVNSVNSITGLNVLHLAVERVTDPEAFEELFHCLVEYNVDLNAASLIGDTPLNWALLLQKDYAAILLIRHGAEVHACNVHSCGLDNLSTVSRRKTNTMARMLLRAGHHPIHIDPTVLDKPDSTVKWLYHACRRPLDLADICRIKIRRMYRGRQLCRYIYSLPLPVSLKRFLMMEDEG